MTGRRPRLRDSDSWRFDVSVLALGTIVASVVTYRVARDAPGATLALAVAAGVPVIAFISRFPITLSHAGGRGLEVSFDSSVLVFLLCTVGTLEAVAVWSLGVAVTEAGSGKRPSARAFNVGLGVMAGGIAATVLHLLGGGGRGTPSEVAAVALAVASFFATDYLLTAVSLSLDSHTSLRRNLAQAGTWLAGGSFLGLNLLGYLGALVLRFSPWWPMTALVAIPVVIVIVAARAVNRGGENRRRLTALLQAAVRAQSLTEGQQIYDALEADARELVGSGDVRLQGGPPGPGEIGSQVKRGRQARWVVAGQRARVADTSADQQVLDALAVVASDALARLQLTEEMVHFARHDPLTDLPNRGILHDRAAHALQRARRRCATVALLLLDLDGFKPVNDRFGHAAGDRVLIEVTDRLRGCVRDGGTVARLGGDEFAVLLEDASREQALVLGERVLEAIRQGILVSGTPMPLSVSIGVALACEDSTPEEILRQADLAMYEAKARGRGRVVEYDPDMGRSRLARLELIEALRDAVAHRRIGLVYQPVVDAATGRIEGVEALARWRVGDVDVPPEEFIAVAEEVGLIVALGEGVLERAAKDAAVLRAVAGRAISVAVNISVQQLREDRFVDVVSRIVDTMGDVQLVLEITEREGVGDDPVVHAAMQEIHSLGVLFAIDDFGVGFSSIGYLRDVPAQIIKADRVLSRNIDRDERACLLLRCITTMGHELGMEVVVEGIERDSQLTTVRDEVHARFAQGFSIHRPMPLAQLIEVLSTPKVSDGAERDRSRTPPSQVLAVVD